MIGLGPGVASVVIILGLTLDSTVQRSRCRSNALNADAQDVYLDCLAYIN